MFESEREALARAKKMGPFAAIAVPLGAETTLKSAEASIAQRPGGTARAVAAAAYGAEQRAGLPVSVSARPAPESTKGAPPPSAGDRRM